MTGYCGALLPGWTWSCPFPLNIFSEIFALYWLISVATFSLSHLSHHLRVSSLQLSQNTVKPPQWTEQNFPLFYPSVLGPRCHCPLVLESGRFLLMLSQPCCLMRKLEKSVLCLASKNPAFFVLMPMFRRDCAKTVLVGQDLLHFSIYGQDHNSLLFFLPKIFSDIF